jgi:hypothetical protein
MLNFSWVDYPRQKRGSIYFIPLPSPTPHFFDLSVAMKVLKMLAVKFRSKNKSKTPEQKQNNRLKRNRPARWKGKKIQAHGNCSDGSKGVAVAHTTPTNPARGEKTDSKTSKGPRFTVTDEERYRYQKIVVGMTDAQIARQLKPGRYEFQGPPLRDRPIGEGELAYAYGYRYKQTACWMNLCLFINRQFLFIIKWRSYQPPVIIILHPLSSARLVAQYIHSPETCIYVPLMRLSAQNNIIGRSPVV